MSAATKSSALYASRWLLCTVLVGLLLGVARGHAATRAALMDFSTDDNSYRSIEAAAQFTSLVQIGLANESEVEWVERSQIHFGICSLLAPCHRPNWAQRTSSYLGS